MAVVAILIGFGVGLTRDLGEPWIGLHDWNGAFFSQLARNQIRYPFALHNGMPIVAVGAEAPAEADQSFYSTHPPGLVWLVAAWMSVFGESEAIARLLPIICSLPTLALLLRLWRQAFGPAHSALAGLFYSVMPLSVYFGRMVDHEAVCLFLMTVVGTLWIGFEYSRASLDLADRPTSIGKYGPRSYAILAGMCMTVIALIWVDWAGCLFAGLFALLLVRRSIAAKNGLRGPCAAVVVAMALATCTMLTFLVYAGLDGRWSDLIAIFTSRASDASGDAPGRSLAAPGSAWINTEVNLTLPLIILAIAGLMFSIRMRMSGGLRPKPRPNTATIGAAEPNQDPAQCDAASVLGLISLTGVIWLALFYRQYLFHQYWIFYLGPMVASLAAGAVITLARLFEARRRRVVQVLLAAAVATTLSHEISGIHRYYSAHPPSLEADVNAWRGIAELTRPDDRIVLFRDPTFVETRGGYTFRNIIPPQFAYYADRAFTVEPDFNRVVELADSHALFVMRLDDAVRFSAGLKPLRRLHPEQLMGERYVIFDLRQPLIGGLQGRGAASPALDSYKP